MILHEIETASRQEIEKLQTERLISTVERAYSRVPFYKERFRENGVAPGDIKSLDDLRKLPFMKKQDLRDHYPFGLFAVELNQVVRIHGSSGTSGKPTIVGYTKKDLENWSEIVARAICLGGGRPGQVLHNAYGYGLFTGGLGLHLGSERLGMITVPVSGGNTDRQIMMIEDFKPTVICGTPSYILTIAERMEELGKNPGETSLKYGIFGAEPWSEEIEKNIGRKICYDRLRFYGLSEVMGPGVAMECYQAQDGLHVAEDHFIIEVIDPETLEPVPEGREGELVFTSLTKEAFPVIRYRTGDIASITREPCSCGRTTTRMSRVKGRIDDMIIIRGVNVFPSELEHYLLKVHVLAPHYQVHLVKKGYLDAVELHVEVTDEFYRAVDHHINHEKVIRLKKEVAVLLKNHCMISFDVKVHPPKTIERSQGKAVRIIDRRNAKIKV